MSVTAVSAVAGVPYRSDISIGTAGANGTINVGDYLCFSGSAVFATNTGHTAYFAASGAGVALESNPVYDQAGRTATNTGLRYLRQGVLRVTGAQSGNPTLGLHIIPLTTGSGVAAPTGLSGIGATWTAIAPVAISSNPTGTVTNAVGQIVGTYNPGQTAQLDVLISPNWLGYYG